MATVGFHLHTLASSIIVFLCKILAGLVCTPFLLFWTYLRGDLEKTLQFPYLFSPDFQVFPTPVLLLYIFRPLVIAESVYNLGVVILLRIFIQKNLCDWTCSYSLVCTLGFCCLRFWYMLSITFKCLTVRFCFIIFCRL